MADIDFANDNWNQDERLAYILYQMDGSQAVIDAVNRGKIRHNEWTICMGCDAERPFLNDECLACGGEKATREEVLGKLSEETEQDKFVCESCGSSEVRETVFRWLNGKEVIEDMGRVFGDVWCEVCDAESEVIAEDKFKKEVINNE